MSKNPNENAIKTTQHNSLSANIHPAIIEEQSISQQSSHQATEVETNSIIAVTDLLTRFSELGLDDKELHHAEKLIAKDNQTSEAKKLKNLLHEIHSFACFWRPFFNKWLKLDEDFLNDKYFTAENNYFVLMAKNIANETLSNIQISKDNQKEKEVYLEKILRTLFLAHKILRTRSRFHAIALFACYKCAPEEIKKRYATAKNKNIKGFIGKLLDSNGLVENHLLLLKSIYDQSALLISKLYIELSKGPGDLFSAMYRIGQQKWLEEGMQALQKCLNSFLKWNNINPSDANCKALIKANQGFPFEFIHPNAVVESFNKEPNSLKITYSPSWTALDEFDITFAYSVFNRQERIVITVSIDILPWFEPEHYKACIIKLRDDFRELRSQMASIPNIESREISVNFVDENDDDIDSAKLRLAVEASLQDNKATKTKPVVSTSMAKDERETEIIMNYMGLMGVRGSVESLNLPKFPDTKSLTADVSAGLSSRLNIHTDESELTRILVESEKDEKLRKDKLRSKLEAELLKKTAAMDCDKLKREQLIVALIDHPQKFLRNAADPLTKAIEEAGIACDILTAIDNKDAKKAKELLTVSAKPGILTISPKAVDPTISAKPETPTVSAKPP